MVSIARALSSKLLLLLFGLVAVLGFALFSPATAHAVDYDIYVSGVRVTSSNASDVLGDGRVEYTSTTTGRGILEISEASIAVADAVGNDAAGIYIGPSMQSVSIMFEGDNDIYMPGDDPAARYINGIVCKASDYLQINGSGSSLEVTLSDYRDSAQPVYGIECACRAQILDASVYFDLSSPEGVYGITVNGDMYVTRSEISIDAYNADTLRGFRVAGDLDVGDSTITVSPEREMVVEYGSQGIFTGGEITVSGNSDVSVRSPKGVNANVSTIGIDAKTLTIEGTSAVHAAAGQSDKSYGLALSNALDPNFSVDAGCVLEASGYQEAIKNGGNPHDDISWMGASVSWQANGTNCVDWGVGNGGDLSGYKYVCIPHRPVVSYRAGVEDSTSWQGWKKDGAMAGTAGQSKRLEGLQIKLENAPYSGDIQYKSQVQSDGWQGWKKNGQTSGYAPKKTGGKRLESVQVKLTGEMARHYDVWYHMQVQRFGWMGWVKNGDTAGSVGYGFRVEAVEIMLMPKGNTPPAVGHNVATPEGNMLSFIRCRSFDNKTWQSAKGEGDVSGTRGQKKTQVRVGLSASSFSASGIDKGDSVIQVRVYQDGKWSGWSSADDAYVGNKDGGPIRGIQARIKPNTTLTFNYNLFYRVEVKNGSKAHWMGWARNGETAGQKNLNLEQIQFSLTRKGYPDPPSKKSDLQPTEEHSKQRWVIERWPCNGTQPAHQF